MRVSLPVHTKTNILQSGAAYLSEPVFDALEESHGYPCRIFTRTDLTKVLFENLPQRETRIRTACGLSDIQFTESGVNATLEDGSTEKASFIIGCDGVHSRTREIIERLSMDRTAGARLQASEQMVSSFQALYGRASYLDGVEKGTFFESRGTGMTTQLYASDSVSTFALFRKIHSPTNERRRYTQEETRDFMQAFANVSVAPNLKAKDLLAKCTWSRLVNQEEGLMKIWHYDRVVLVGDSVHKMTSNAGMGLNCALQSSVLLMNELQKISTQADLDVEAFGKVFATYGETRFREVQPVYDMSAKVVRTTTWSTWGLWFLDQYVVPLIGLRRVIGSISQTVIRRGRLLNYVTREGRQGTLPWTE
ncbi:uncharacterized protein JN550_012122 [Neoarthrinium moseri]|uniref:uncharacterized protein n=1 Tax=Neoarthrinium moseri TaxID=1658444 RepID=UPI001FDBE156|nr:uncharacterized protein JN550_012122 [Neoarthrinium moseri]KAI1859313.1 hypothetical protein JN550_012122 [Neoarthrinium moseri]